MKRKICIITTLWSSINNWVKPFLKAYKACGIEVTIACNMDEKYESSLLEEFPFVKTCRINFPRGINFSGSLKSIKELQRFFKKEHFDMVQYSTPNASVYASIAAKRMKIPVRLYCQWGMVYVSRRGIKRYIFKLMEKMICKNSTIIQPDSIGNLEFCRKEKLYDEKKSEVIWNGSAKGLDFSKYDITQKENYRTEIRVKYKIPSDAVVLGFVGRLGAEKGCNELFDVFQELEKSYNNLYLLFVGPMEKQNTIRPELLSYFETDCKIIKTGRVTDVEKYMSAMDVFVLPSYREGFGMSVIEAEAMEVPVVVTQYPGPTGGMADGKTGCIVPQKDKIALKEAIMRLLDDSDLRTKLGKNGRVYVKENFDSDVFMQKYMENRKKLLSI